MRNRHWTLCVGTQRQTRRFEISTLFLQTTRIRKNKSRRFGKKQGIMIANRIKNSQSFDIIQRNAKLSAHLARARMHRKHYLPIASNPFQCAHDRSQTRLMIHIRRTMQRHIHKTLFLDTEFFWKTTRPRLVEIGD